MITYEFYYKNKPRILHNLHTGEEQAKEFYHQHYKAGDEVEVYAVDDTANVTSSNFKRKMLWD